MAIEQATALDCDQLFFTRKTVTALLMKSRRKFPISSPISHFYMWDRGKQLQIGEDKYKAAFPIYMMGLSYVYQIVLPRSPVYWLSC